MREINLRYYFTNEHGEFLKFDRLIIEVEGATGGFIRQIHESLGKEWKFFSRMYSTGLYDKKGVEIFEGDVVAIEGETTEGFYRTDQFEVTINDFTKVHVIDSHRGQENLHKVNQICEVVGNIYEMPDWEF